MTLLRREHLCVLEASPPQSSPRGSCAARSSPEVSVPAPMCCDRHFLSTDGWRGSDGEGEVMQPQTLVPTKRCSSRGSSTQFSRSKFNPVYIFTQILFPFLPHLSQQAMEALRDLLTFVLLSFYNTKKSKALFPLCSQLIGMKWLGRPTYHSSLA